MDADKRIKKKLDSNNRKYNVLSWTNRGSNTPQKSICTTTYLPSQKPYKKYKRGSTVEERLNSWDVLVWIPIHRYLSVGRPERTDISSMWTLDVVGRTCRERWMIRRNGERKKIKEIRDVSLSWWLWRRICAKFECCQGSGLNDISTFTVYLIHPSRRTVVVLFNP